MVFQFPRVRDRVAIGVDPWPKVYRIPIWIDDGCGVWIGVEEELAKVIGPIVIGVGTGVAEFGVQAVVDLPVVGHAIAIGIAVGLQERDTDRTRPRVESGKEDPTRWGELARVDPVVFV